MTFHWCEHSRVSGANLGIFSSLRDDKSTGAVALSLTFDDDDDDDNNLGIFVWLFTRVKTRVSLVQIWVFSIQDGTTHLYLFQFPAVGKPVSLARLTIKWQPICMVFHWCEQVRVCSANRGIFNPLRDDNLPIGGRPQVSGNLSP